jgi:MFS family permease
LDRPPREGREYSYLPNDSLEGKEEEKKILSRTSALVYPYLKHTIKYSCQIILYPLIFPYIPHILLLALHPSILLIVDRVERAIASPPVNYPPPTSLIDNLFGSDPDLAVRESVNTATMSDHEKANSVHSTESDLRRASEAMQRAATAMIAVTESFRKQFQDQQQLAPPAQKHLSIYNPYRPLSGDEPTSSAAQEVSKEKDAAATYTATASTAEQVPIGLSRPYDFPTWQPAQVSGATVAQFNNPYSSATHPQAPTPVPAPAPLAEFLPARPVLPRVNTTTIRPQSGRAAAIGGQPIAGPPPMHYARPIGDMTPTTDWPVGTGSTPTLAPVYTPARLSHVDVADAADRYKSHRPAVYQHSQLGMSRPSIDQFAPYTVIRTDSEDVTRPLVNEIRRKPVANPVPTKPKQAPYSGIHEYAFVGIICIAQMLMLAGISQALVPGLIISQSFPGTTFGDIAWYSAAYGLTSGTFVLPAGRLGDLFGHKKIFTIGFLWFSLWSLLAGLAIYVPAGGANGTIYFCFCRAMQGIGPSLLVPNGQAMLGRAYPPGPRKNMVMCLFGASAPFGFVVGAVMASLFAVRGSWEWGFYVLAAVCLGLAGLSLLILPSAEGKTKLKETESLWVQLDLVGMLLGVSGLVLFNFAWNQATIVGWSTPYTYFLLIISILFLATFIYVEKVATHPLVPISAMTSSTNFVLGCTAAGWGCFSVWVFYTIQILEVLRGWDALLTSAAFAHAPISGLIASLLTGYLMSKIKPHSIMLISMCGFFVGSVLMATAPVEQIYWANTFLSILIMPFGMDMSNPAATILLSNSVSKEHQGIAASLVVTMVNYSISIALGFAGTVDVQLNNHGENLLAGYRGAQYFGIGLGGLGVILALAFLLVNKSRAKAPFVPKIG